MHDLIKSLEAGETEDPSAVERAWAAELEERATKALSGESPGRSLETFCDELKAKRRGQT